MATNRNECFSEGRVAEVLGVSREQVRAWRQEHLKEGAGFVRDGREVTLTQAGLDAVMAAFGVGAQSPEKKEGAADSRGAAVGGAAAGEGEESGALPDGAGEADGMPSEAEKTPEKKEEGAADLFRVPVAVEMVVRVLPRNPRILIAAEKKEGGVLGPECRVKVRDNRKFVLGMAIRAMATMTQDVFQLAGRAPRYKGKF